MSSLRFYIVLFLAVGLPRVESPLPETVGLSLPLTAAGAAGVLAGLAFIRARPAKRERAINYGGLLGFAAGALFYLVSLAAQLLSS